MSARGAGEGRRAVIFQEKGRRGHTSEVEKEGVHFNCGRIMKFIKGVKTKENDVLRLLIYIFPLLLCY